MSAETLDRETLRLRLESIFHDVFTDDSITISDATTAADVDDWDPLMHITLLAHIEKTFNMRFNLAEIGALNNVGELLTLIVKRHSA